MNPVEVTVSCASADQAKHIIRVVVEQGLAVCGQTWPIESTYWWNGEITDDVEHLVVFKTVDVHFAAVCDLVIAHHSYDLPAITMLPVASTGPGVIDWLLSSVRPEGYTV